jgi:hypothetical protein
MNGRPILDVTFEEIIAAKVGDHAPLPNLASFTQEYLWSYA